jgi:hypothetical protein
MMISAGALGAIVLVAATITTLAPILLVALFIRDWKGGCLW